MHNSGVGPARSISTFRSRAKATLDLDCTLRPPVTRWHDGLSDGPGEQLLAVPAAAYPPLRQPDLFLVCQRQLAHDQKPQLATRFSLRCPPACMGAQQRGGKLQSGRIFCDCRSHMGLQRGRDSGYSVCGRCFQWHSRSERARVRSDQQHKGICRLNPRRMADRRCRDRGIWNDHR